ncbi:MAG: hypothetical protein KAK00_06140 [Nanoarchaeota archaeon]|nr:hypothetical protein [Nanoarchaeota archaeon]
MRVRFIILLLVTLVFLDFAHAATIHGAVYNPDLDLIHNVEVEINTTPKQSHISKNGLYFFNVPVGSYRITAEQYYQKELVYSAEKVIEISKDGEFKIDIIMEQMPGVVIPSDVEDLGPSLLSLLRARYGYFFYIAVLLLILLILLVLFLIVVALLDKKKKSTSADIQEVDVTSNAESAKNSEELKEEIQLEQMPDLDGIIDFIKKEGGRTTQKEIRRKFPLSEAKISLMISELESKGKLEKIKKGRGNILILK